MLKEYFKSKHSSYIILAAFILFFSINIIGRYGLDKYDFDFTEEGIFTLSDGTKNILAKVEEPIKFRLFFSNKLANGIPNLKSYALRVRGILEKYASYSNDNITLEVIDPEPFSDEEDLAVSYGLNGVKIDQIGTKLYFGLVATNSVDDVQSIPFFHFNREKFIEYDLSRLVYELANPKNIKIGILSTIPMQGSPMMGIPGMGGKDWGILSQLRKMFLVENIAQNTEEISKDIDVLMLVQPQNLSEETLYAIDQYVLSGGKAMIFADPNVELTSIEPDKRGFSKNINRLFSSWGVAISPETVVGDRLLVRDVKFDSVAKGVVGNITNIALTQDNIDREDITTSMLKTIIMSSAGAIRETKNHETKITPLLYSSNEAMEVSVDKVVGASDSNLLLREFAAQNESYVMAARITGPASTAFPHHNVKANHISKSKTPINVVLITDVDMLRDDLWVEYQRFSDFTIARPISDNGAFVVNLADHLSGSSDLIGLRGRAVTTRPFDVVDDLKRKAEKKFLAKEDELKIKLARTERRLAQIQKDAQNSSGGISVYKAKQQDAIKQFTDQMTDIRKELRGVRGELRKDIESLGDWLKFINIILVPLLILIGAMSFGIYRQKKRKQQSL
ncbi:Gldg family protein [Rickettsiales bacterium]|nr:Gldg family protein [Rickettsiales bacterium]